MIIIAVYFGNVHFYMLFLYEDFCVNSAKLPLRVSRTVHCSGVVVIVVVKEVVMVMIVVVMMVVMVVVVMVVVVMVVVMMVVVRIARIFEQPWLISGSGRGSGVGGTWQGGGLPVDKCRPR